MDAARKILHPARNILEARFAVLHEAQQHAQRGNNLHTDLELHAGPLGVHLPLLEGEVVHIVELLAGKRQAELIALFSEPFESFGALIEERQHLSARSPHERHHERRFLGAVLHALDALGEEGQNLRHGLELAGTVLRFNTERIKRLDHRASGNDEPVGILRSPRQSFTQAVEGACPGVGRNSGLLKGRA